MEVHATVRVRNEDRLFGLTSVAVLAPTFPVSSVVKGEVTWVRSGDETWRPVVGVVRHTESGGNSEHLVSPDTLERAINEVLKPNEDNDRYEMRDFQNDAKLIRLFKGKGRAWHDFRTNTSIIKELVNSYPKDSTGGPEIVLKLWKYSVKLKDPRERVAVSWYNEDTGTRGHECQYAGEDAGAPTYLVLLEFGTLFWPLSNPAFEATLSLRYRWVPAVKGNPVDKRAEQSVITVLARRRLQTAVVCIFNMTHVGRQLREAFLHCEETGRVVAYRVVLLRPSWAEKYNSRLPRNSPRLQPFKEKLEGEQRPPPPLTILTSHTGLDGAVDALQEAARTGSADCLVSCVMSGVSKGSVDEVALIVHVADLRKVAPKKVKTAPVNSFHVDPKKRMARELSNALKILGASEQLPYLDVVVSSSLDLSDLLQTPATIKHMAKALKSALVLPHSQSKPLLCVRLVPVSVNLDIILTGEVTTSSKLDNFYDFYALEDMVCFKIPRMFNEKNVPLDYKMASFPHVLPTSVGNETRLEFRDTLRLKSKDQLKSFITAASDEEDVPLILHHGKNVICIMQTQLANLTDLNNRVTRGGYFRMRSNEIKEALSKSVHGVSLFLVIIRMAAAANTFETDARSLIRMDMPIFRVFEVLRRYARCISVVFKNSDLSLPRDLLRQLKDITDENERDTLKILTLLEERFREFLRVFPGQGPGEDATPDEWHQWLSAQVWDYDLVPTDKCDPAVLFVLPRIPSITPGGLISISDATIDGCPTKSSALPHITDAFGVMFDDTPKQILSNTNWTSVQHRVNIRWSAMRASRSLDSLAGRLSKDHPRIAADYGSYIFQMLDKPATPVHLSSIPTSMHEISSFVSLLEQHHAGFVDSSQIANPAASPSVTSASLPDIVIRLFAISLLETDSSSGMEVGYKHLMLPGNLLNMLCCGSSFPLATVHLTAPEPNHTKHFYRMVMWNQETSKQCPVMFETTDTADLSIYTAVAWWLSTWCEAVLLVHTVSQEGAYRETVQPIALTYRTDLLAAYMRWRQRAFTTAKDVTNLTQPIEALETFANVNRAFTDMTPFEQTYLNELASILGDLFSSTSDHSLGWPFSVDGWEVDPNLDPTPVARPGRGSEEIPVVWLELFSRYFSVNIGVLLTSQPGFGWQQTRIGEPKSVTAFMLGVADISVPDIPFRERWMPTMLIELQHGLHARPLVIDPFHSSPTRTYQWTDEKYAAHILSTDYISPTPDERPSRRAETLIAVAERLGLSSQYLFSSHAPVEPGAAAVASKDGSIHWPRGSETFFGTPLSQPAPGGSP